MAAAFAARASRQSMILVAVVGLHVGLLVLMAAGTNLPPLPDWVPKPIRITNLPPPPKPLFERPELPDPLRVEPGTVPQPPLDIPAIPDRTAAQDAIRAPAGLHAAQDSDIPTSVIQSPRQRTRDSRLAALVDACYPSASRRLGEEGRAVVRVTIAADGGIATWSVAQSSGFARLDAAVSCVLRRLEFEPGRRDGRAVDADVLLPITFQLN
jgi:periplasmic protein TonB